MKVFKFGGASLRDVDNIQNVGKILSDVEDEPVVVVSAMGKTTNALEQILYLSRIQRDSEAEELLNKLFLDHKALAEALIQNDKQVVEMFETLYQEMKDALKATREEGYDFAYDQFVSYGEIMSSRIVGNYLNSIGISCFMYDSRDIIITDNTYREAKVDWEETQRQVKKLKLHEQPEKVKLFQGFIGGTTDGTTTLGREGSDFSAAILSYCIDAESMTIWKDVEGVLTGDPRKFENVEKIDHLSYKEAIEMTYYGAKVIHPKTIKPIQNKNIPLFVKPFQNPEKEGTKIQAGIDREYPPVVVIEPNQALLYISSKDFSFIAEDHLSRIFRTFTENRIKVNMMRNSAISFTVCISFEDEKLEAAISDLTKDFNVLVEKDLELITIRHFSKTILEEMKKNKMVLFEERLRNTIQIVVKEVPLLKRRN